MTLLSDDIKCMEDLSQHAKHGSFSVEDIEAFKYTFATYSAY